MLVSLFLACPRLEKLFTRRPLTAEHRPHP